ncbi:MAG: Lrp/AsnC family transcriptional regulator [Nanoarchaeota archaeon]
MKLKVLRSSTSSLYNIKKLEKLGAIRAYKAIFDYKKIDEGFCAFVLIAISPEEYGDPEKMAVDLAKLQEVESADICTGDWEIILKVRVKDQEEYYQLVKNVISRKGIEKINTITSLKQVKSDFIKIS